MTDRQNPIFHDETKARKWLESQVWPDGPFCPHCGSVEVTALKGKAHRVGLYQCKQKECRQQFTVTVGTLYERPNIPLSKRLMATYLLCSSKQALNTLQLRRQLGVPVKAVSVKSSWFMMHRIRESMREKHTEPMGGAGKTVQADETYIGRTHYRKGEVGSRGHAEKEKVFTLIEDGKARSFHVPSVNAKTLKPIMRQQISRDSVIFTDEAGVYSGLRREFAQHFSVNHSIKEYVRGPVTTNA